MSIDVILPTYNRSRCVGTAIESVMTARLPDCPVHLFVIDNNSRDGAAAVIAACAERWPSRMTCLFEPEAGKHSALNAGIRAGRADVVALIDDDERATPDWLCVLARSFADPAVDYVAGEMRPDWKTAKPSWLPRGYAAVLSMVDNGPVRRRFGEPGFNGMPVGGNMAIRRSMLDRCGPYVAGYDYADDLYMYMRLQQNGAAGWYEPGLVVWHEVPEARLSKRYYRHWVHTEGHVRAKERREMPTAERSILGTPLWSVRRAATSARNYLAAAVSGDAPRRFQSELELRQFWAFASALSIGRRERYVDRTSFYRTPATPG